MTENFDEFDAKFDEFDANFVNFDAFFSFSTDGIVGVVARLLHIILLHVVHHHIITSIHKID